MKTEEMKRTETPEERRARRYAQSRAWALAHPEKTREYGRRHYWKNVEKRRTASNAYNRAHTASRSAYSHEYYLRRRREDPEYYALQNEKNKERQRRKREERRQALLPKPPRTPKPVVRSYEWLVGHCQRTLNQYTYSAISRAREACGDRVDEYFLKYPFEEFAEREIRYRLIRYGIHPSCGAYADCYDAGMLAYLYTIHRCAQMQYEHVSPYFLKMLRIYVMDALIVYRDAHNLCRINHFREVPIDLEGMQRYV